MNNKLYIPKSHTIKNDKSSEENLKDFPAVTNPKPSIDDSANNVVYHDKDIQITIKKCKSKRIPATVNTTPKQNKQIDEGKALDVAGTSKTKWNQILRQQNHSIMKKSLQSSNMSNKITKPIKSNDTKDIKRHVGTQRGQRQVTSQPSKNSINVIEKGQKESNRLNRIKEKSCQSTVTGLINHVTSAIVVDKAVQCNRVFDSYHENLDVFNPIRTLGFLIKELEDFTKDEKSNKILTEMKQALLRIPVEPEKTSYTDIESAALRRKLEVNTAQTEELSKELSTVCDALSKTRIEKDSLVRKARQQTILLEEAERQQVDLKKKIKILQSDLNKAQSTIYDNEQQIIKLKEENSLLTVKLESEEKKVLLMSAYENTQLTDLRKLIKELQSQNPEKLLNPQNEYENDDETHFNNLMGPVGIACSSPNNTFSEHSPILTSYEKYLSNVSLSEIKSTMHEISDMNSNSSNQNKVKLFSDNVRSKKINGLEMSKHKDPSNLEFVSLAAYESSQMINCPSYKDHTNKESKQSVIPQERTVLVNDDVYNVSDTIPHVLDNMNGEHRHKQEYRRNTSKQSKHSEDEEENNNKEESIAESLKLLETIASNNKNSYIKQRVHEIQHIIKDMKATSKAPINVPSPPRKCPYQAWSDTSSLPSISIISELNVAQSHDI